MERYRHLRAIQRSLVQQMLKTLSKRAIDETARRLGFRMKGRVILDEHGELDVCLDSAVYDYLVDGQNAVGRFAARHKPEGDERAVLVAMLDSCPTVIEIQERLPGRGARVLDVLAAVDRIVSDDGLSTTAEPGLCLVARLLEIDGIVMTSGAPGWVPPAVADMLRLASPLEPKRWSRSQRAVVGSLLCRLTLTDTNESAKETLVAFILHGTGPLAEALRAAIAKRESGIASVRR